MTENQDGLDRIASKVHEKLEDMVEAAYDQGYKDGFNDAVELYEEAEDGDD